MEQGMDLLVREAVDKTRLKIEASPPCSAISRRSH